MSWVEQYKNPRQAEDFTNPNNGNGPTPADTQREVELMRKGYSLEDIRDGRVGNTHQRRVEVTELSPEVVEHIRQRLNGPGEAQDHLDYIAKRSGEAQSVQQNFSENGGKLSSYWLNLCRHCGHYKFHHLCCPNCGE